MKTALIAKEWDFEKNVMLPSEVAEHSGKKAWWICEHGHSWQTTIIERRMGKGCP